MKLYITFDSAHIEPAAKRGLTASANGWWEVIAPNYAVARAVAWAAFDGVFAFDYDEYEWDPKWYPLGCMGTITVGQQAPIEHLVVDDGEIINLFVEE